MCAVSARNAVRKAIHEGRLIRPEICSKCGKKPKPGSIVGYHESYKPKKWLKVIWLCTGCCLQMHHATHKNSWRIARTRWDKIKNQAELK
jgi:hypothetical protein